MVDLPLFKSTKNKVVAPGPTFGGLHASFDALNDILGRRLFGYQMGDVRWPAQLVVHENTKKYSTNSIKFRSTRELYGNMWKKFSSYVFQQVAARYSQVLC